MRPRRRALAAFVALLAACAATGSAASSRPVCSSPAARAVIARLHPRLPGAGRVDAGLIDTVICFDLTGDGRRDLAVTIASGGTAGDVGWLAIVATSRGWRVALGRSGYKVGLAREGRDLVETQPIYGKNDPNCCPTGGFDHRRWHWNGNRFVVVRSWQTQTYRP